MLADGLDWIRKIQATRTQPLLAPGPRVFVSHRQIDDNWARRNAWLAWDEKTDHWLDVIDLDPSLNRQVQLLEINLGRSLTPLEKAILTAAIIEMALLNCTDVIAVMTRHTAGSQWVPYEYGRVKDSFLYSANVACWHDHTSLPASDLAEYLYLGAILPNEHSIRTWYRSAVNATTSGRGGKAAGAWNGPTPPTLPTK